MQGRRVRQGLRGHRRLRSGPCVWADRGVRVGDLSLRRRGRLSARWRGDAALGAPSGSCSSRAWCSSRVDVAGSRWVRSPSAGARPSPPRRPSRAPRRPSRGPCRRRRCTRTRAARRSTRSPTAASRCSDPSPTRPGRPSPASGRRSPPRARSVRSRRAWLCPVARCSPSAARTAPSHRWRRCSGSTRAPTPGPRAPRCPGAARRASPSVSRRASSSTREASPARPTCRTGRRRCSTPRRTPGPRRPTWSIPTPTGRSSRSPTVAPSCSGATRL